MGKASLEEKAKKLLCYKITGKGEVPNPFTPNFLEQIQYLLNNKYIVRCWGTQKCISYSVTDKGRKWALGK